MKIVAFVVGVAFVAAALVAPAAAQMKQCDELKGEIEEKIKKNGVSDYTLDVVATADVKDAAVVGSCEGGTKKITYKRGGGDGAAKTADKAADKPADKAAGTTADKPATKTADKPAAKTADKAADKKSEKAAEKK